MTSISKRSLPNNEIGKGHKQTIGKMFKSTQLDKYKLEVHLSKLEVHLSINVN